MRVPLLSWFKPALLLVLLACQGTAAMAQAVMPDTVNLKQAEAAKWLARASFTFIAANRAGRNALNFVALPRNGRLFAATADKCLINRADNARFATDDQGNLVITLLAMVPGCVERVFVIDPVEGSGQSVDMVWYVTLKQKP